MIYLDNAATTKPNKNALVAATADLDENFFNPSAFYAGGVTQKTAITQARNYLLKTLRTTEHNLIFTSCGTEADNQAIFCAVKRGVFVTTKGEHSAVYQSFCELAARGLKTVFIDVNPDGSVSEEKLYETLLKTDDVSLISIVHVNNETGAINDIAAISKKCKEICPRALFHSDGVQAYGKLDFTLPKTVDFYSVSAHKIGGIKGVGALAVKKGTHVSPLLFGGGQENGLRSGTENVFGIKTFEFAAKERFLRIRENYAAAERMKNAFLSELDKTLFTVLSPETGSPYIVTVSARGLRGEVVMHALETEGVVVGNGSACSSKNRYSRILSACGYFADVLDGVVRVSFSPENTEKDANAAANKLNETARRLLAAKNKRGA